MKKTWVRKTLSAGVLAAGALLLAPAAVAQADIGQANAANAGFLNGTQIAMPVTVPVNLVGNSAAVAGVSRSIGAGANQVENGRKGGIGQVSAGNRGFANGTQVAVPVTVPVNVAGNAAAVAGAADAKGVSANRLESTKTAEHGWYTVGGGSDIGQANVGNVGWLNGTQVAMPVTIPANACGNSLALIGGSSAYGACANQIGGGFGGQVVQPYESTTKKAKRTENGSGLFPGSGSSLIGIGQANYRNRGFANGSQVAAPITVPINACGNSLGVLGYASAFGSCANHIGGGVAYRQPVQFVKPLVPVYPVPGYVVGEDDCGDWGNDVQDYSGDDCKDDDGDVRGDQGGYGDQDDQGNDDAGYDKGGRDDVDELPADDTDVKGDGYGTAPAPAAVDHQDTPKAPGYVKGDKGDKGDKYGNKAGGRSAEESAVSGLTQQLGGTGTAGLGGFDLLGTLR
ncbi:chaplin family protein [Actinoplanes utahensis]|uniref:Chaplin domain-containing protein n=1 Tax=Actinoplanes utahensis TaxID=1869 RepID=A0A0A6UJQ7_ACTUT|nr:chaplin family protein [Actinoplanes utahensis]KHD76320.1 hypothetical protein MB27_18115 [Actinoplanes utahensis]GIF30963.1 hypothetical protein Aut01nite_39490 [Actinoplanes utahensis]